MWRTSYIVLYELKDYYNNSAKRQWTREAAVEAGEVVRFWMHFVERADMISNRLAVKCLVKEIGRLENGAAIN